MSNLPWDYEIVEDRESSVAVRFSVRTQKTPFFLERTMRLVLRERRAISLEERVVNESAVPLRAMWGHHLAFGRPFLKEGCRVRIPGEPRVVPHPVPTDQAGRRIRGDWEHLWPVAEGESGEEVDLSVLPPSRHEE